MKKVLSVALVMLLVLVSGCAKLTGDKKKMSDSKDSDKEITSLLMYRQGDKPGNFDELMKVINEQMIDEVGVQLNIQYIGWGDYEKKMSVITSSGEDYDIAFASNYVNTAQKGAYMDLTELAPKYAKETYENLNPHYIEGNLVDGKLFSIPVNGNVYGQTRIAFEQELLAKYDLDISQVTSISDLEPLLEVIKENEPKITPINFGPNNRVGQMDYVYDHNVPLGIDTSTGLAEIINPYKDSEQMITELKAMHAYYKKGYVAQDAATRDSDIRLVDKGWFVRFPTQGPFDYGDAALTRAAGREIVSVPLSKQIIDNKQMFVANFVISNVSKNAEKALQAINLINTNQDLLTTMVYGLEGEAWEKTENERIKLLPGYDSTKTIGGAWSTGDNKKIYLDESVTDEQVSERDKSIENSETSPLLGFNFNSDKVKTEITNISNVSSQYLSALHSGTIDPEKTLPEFNKKLDEAGLSKVQKEMQAQFKEFQASK